VLPKVNSAAEVAQIASLVADRGTRLLITLESAAGVAHALDILSAAPKGALVGYGSADHMAETGGTMQAESLAWGRAQVVNAAANAGIPALDGVWLDYKDQAGLAAEAQLVQAMGFSGKIAIHPDQVAPINVVFSPSNAEIETAREMVAAAHIARGGAFSFNGKMVDAPVLARAHRLLDYSNRSIS
jgi:citrate lyase beta subunit